MKDRVLSILPLLAFILAQSPVDVAAQSLLEEVIVETYYITDAFDGTDTIGVPGGIPDSTVTYRVYLDLCDSCALKSIFGDANHELSISSTCVFFNNLDRGKVFGHEVNNSALDENTVALDSWLSMGAASNQKYGILKPEDADGSIVGGANNDGGSLPVPGGLLLNADPGAGLPLTTHDGLVPLNGGTALPPGFSVIGDDPEPVFKDSTLFSSFVSNSFFMNCIAPGVKGPTQENKVLVAQLTTCGELSFALNIELIRPDGSLIRIVADDSLLQTGELANGALNYPPVCGCTDPGFLEFDPNAGCDDGSCQTVIVFGCLDTVACNYDPLANFNVSQLCCYGPDSCNGLDVTIVCPDVSVNEAAIGARTVLFPNPAGDAVTVMPAALGQRSTSLVINDALGRHVLAPTNSIGSGPLDLHLGTLAPGTYLMVIRMDEHIETHRLVKH